jgi:hypothetical protein
LLFFPRPFSSPIYTRGANTESSSVEC